MGRNELLGITGWRLRNVEENKKEGNNNRSFFGIWNKRYNWVFIGGRWTSVAGDCDALRPQLLGWNLLHLGERAGRLSGKPGDERDRKRREKWSIAFLGRCSAWIIYLGRAVHGNSIKGGSRNGVAIARTLIAGGSRGGIRARFTVNILMISLASTRWCLNAKRAIGEYVKKKHCN